MSKKVKASWCYWRKKTFSNYSTQTPTSLNLADRWLRGFFFLPFKWVCVLSAIPAGLLHLPHNPLAFHTVSTVESWYAPQNHFRLPTSAPWQQHADSWHHNSLCLCWKRLQRAREKLTPYFTIRTRQWNNHLHWQVARELFLFFFIALSSIKQADVWKPLILVSGHMYCSLSLTWSHGPALCQRLVGFSKAPLYILSFITVTSFKVKTRSWGMEDREAISHPFRCPPRHLISGKTWMVVNGERPFLVPWRLSV